MLQISIFIGMFFLCGLTHGQSMPTSKPKIQMTDDQVSALTKNEKNLALKSFRINKSQSTNEFLKTQGYKDDQDSLDAFYKLNPELTASKTLKVDERVHLLLQNQSTNNLANKTNLGEIKPGAIFENDVIRAKTEVDNIQKNLKLNLPNQSNLQTQLKQTQTIVEAAELLRDNDSNLSGIEIALSKFYIDDALRETQNISNSSHPDPTAFMRANETAQNLNEINANIRARRSPHDIRTLTVNLRASTAAAIPEPMWVYVLPTAVFDSPTFYTLDEIKSYLRTFTFSKATSPAIGEIARRGVTLWIGPIHAYQEMADLVQKRKISKSYTSNRITMTSTSAALDLIWPDDVNVVTRHE